MSGPCVTLAYVQSLAHTLEGSETGRDPLRGLRIRTRDDGQVALEVLPAGVYGRLLPNGYRAEVWMQAGVSREEVTSSCGGRARAWAPGGGRVALVMGAGTHLLDRPARRPVQALNYFPRVRPELEVDM